MRANLLCRIGLERFVQQYEEIWWRRRAAFQGNNLIEMSARWKYQNRGFGTKKKNAHNVAVYTWWTW